MNGFNIIKNYCTNLFAYKYIRAPSGRDPRLRGNVILCVTNNNYL